MTLEKVTIRCPHCGEPLELPGMGAFRVTCKACQGTIGGNVDQPIDLRDPLREITRKFADHLPDSLSNAERQTVLDAGEALQVATVLEIIELANERMRK